MIHLKVAHTKSGFVAILHKTAVVEKNNSYLYFNTGGWETMSTQKAMNLVLREKMLAGFYVSRAKGQFTLETPTGKIAFKENKAKVKL